MAIDVKDHESLAKDFIECMSIIQNYHKELLGTEITNLSTKITALETKILDAKYSGIYTTYDARQLIEIKAARDKLVRYAADIYAVASGIIDHINSGA